MPKVRVQYTVVPSFVETNRANIEAVMEALNALSDDRIQYAAFVLADGCTFMHVALFESEEARSVLTGLPEFQRFQAALKASGPTSPPQAQPIKLVGMAWGRGVA